AVFTVGAGDTSLYHVQCVDEDGVGGGCEDVGAVDDGQAAYLHVLADLGDDRGAGFIDGLAGGQLGGLQGLVVGGAGGQRGLGDGLGEGQEVGVLGHEVGLGVDLHQHGLAAVLGDRDAAVGGR